MIMPPTPDTRPDERLFLRQHSQQPKHDRHAAVELHAHEAVRHGVGDVLEVHGLAFDQHADGDDGVEGTGGVAGGGRDGGGEGGGLLGGELLHCERQLVAAGHGLGHDVGGKHALGQERGRAACEEGVDDGGVPPRVDDRDAEGGA